MAYELPLLTIENVTHDTFRLVFNRPSDFSYSPGQACGWGLDQDGLRDADHPFTMTSLPDQDQLEFIIKTYDTAKYPEHSGFTEAISKMSPGDKAILGEPFGSLNDRGDGVFIAGGAGVTPFVPIFEQRANDNSLKDSTLLFSNKTERDIICKERLLSLDGLNCILTVTDEDAEGIRSGMIDADFIKSTTGFSHRFYVCGPPPMMEAILECLAQNGVDKSNIVVDEGWLD